MGILVPSTVEFRWWGQTWWLMLAGSAPERLVQEDQCKFKDNLGYIMSYKIAWDP